MGILINYVYNNQTTTIKTGDQTGYWYTSIA